MEEDNTQNKNKQQTKAGKKKNIEKGEDKLFLLGNINANINVFSQLSNMYQGQLNVNDTSASQGTGVKSEKSTDSDLAFEQFLFSQKQFDFDVTKILNKINKKSETTKLKALTELKTLLSERNVEFYKEFFATWLYIYKQFVTSEFDKKIIEECNNILQIMAPKLKKDLAPYIKQLFPVWYMCMNDPSAEISTSATKAFEDTFPPQKYIAVLTACEDNLLEHIRKTLRLTPVKVLEENHVLTEVQAEEVYDRNILSCLNSVSAAFKLVSETEHRERYVNKIVEMFCLNKPLKGSDLFGLLHNKKRPRVRAGTIELIDSFFKYVPEDIIKLNLGLISTTLFEMLDDKDRSVQRSIWKSCLLVVLKKAASDPEIASKIDVKKYEVKILNLLKSGGYGLGSQMYINLVQFFSYLESFSAKKDENIKAKINDRIGFYKKFFEHILQAYNHEEVRFFGNDLTNSYFECALFCILKRVIPFLEEAKATLSNENELKNMVGILRGFIRDILIPPCQLFISNYSATSALSPYKNIPVCLGNTLGHAEFKQDLQDLGVYSEFEDKFLDLFKQSLAKFHEFDNYCTLLREAIQVKPGSAFYSYFQNLVSQLNSYFQDTLKEGLGKESVVLSDSVLEKQFEELKKVEHFISIFILENSPLKKDRFINLIVNNVKLAFDLTKKFLASSDKIVKVSNIEKFAKFNLGIINDLIQVNQRNVEKLGKIQELDDVFNSLIEIFSANLNNPNDAISFNLHNLILINYLVNPSSLDNFFSDFISYNNNKIAEDTLLNRALESYVKKFKNVNSYSSYKIKHPQQQKLIRDLAIKILKSDKYRMFSSTILNALLFTSDEETVKQVLATFSSHLNLLHDNKGKLTIEFDKLEYIFSSLANLLKAKEFEANAGPEITNCYQTLIKILINLYYGGGASKKKIIIIYDLLKKVPNEDKIPKESLVKGVKDQILVSLQQKVFEQLELNLVNLDNKQKLKIENLCKLVEDYLKFAQTSKKSNFTGNFYQELLQEKYFINSMIYPGIWQVLMTALKAIQQGSDYKSVFHIKGNQKLVDKFYWLILDMISVANSNCLFLSAQEKKFFANISNNYFMNETLTELETKEEDRNNAALEFLKYAMNKCLSKSIIYSNGVKKLLKSLFAESQDLKVVQSILEIVIIQNLKEIQKELSNENNDLNNTFKRAIVHKNIMPVFEKYIPDTQEAWTEIAKGFQNNVQDIVNQNQSDSNSVQKFIISLDVIGSIIAFNSKAMFEDEPLTQIIKFLFTQIKVQDLKEEKFDPNYTLNTIFEFINLVIENKTFTPLSDNIIEIENFFLFGLEYNKVPRKFSSSALIKMNMFLRKVLTYIEVFTEEFRDQVLRGILSICKIKSHEITTTIDLGGQDVTSINNELNDLMITEFAETIARMRMSIGASFDESLLYDLLDLDLTTIQKSAFVLIVRKEEKRIDYLETPLSKLPLED